MGCLRDSALMELVTRIQTTLPTGCLLAMTMQGLTAATAAAAHQREGTMMKVNQTGSGVHADSRREARRTRRQAEEDAISEYGCPKAIRGVHVPFCTKECADNGYHIFSLDPNTLGDYSTDATEA